MKKTLLILAGLALSLPALAHEYTVGALKIGHPWSRALPAASQNGAAYFSVDNPGSEPDRLLSASTPRAQRAELHNHINDNGVMRMRQVPDVAVPVGQKVSFMPGSLHVMLMGLTAPLKVGDRFPMTLRFEKAGEVTVDVVVQADAPAVGAHSH